MYDSVKLLSDPSLIQNLLEVRSKCLYWVRRGVSGTGLLLISTKSEIMTFLKEMKVRDTNFLASYMVQ